MNKEQKLVQFVVDYLNEQTLSKKYYVNFNEEYFILKSDIEKLFNEFLDQQGMESDESSYDRGFDDGYDEGIEEGERKGYKDGYDEGYDDGRGDKLTEYHRGYKEGYEDGELEGKNKGYQEGRDEGYEDGYEIGKYDKD